jgi:serine/threonine protein kinase
MESLDVVGSGVYGTVYRVPPCFVAEHMPHIDYPLVCKSIQHHTQGAAVMHDTAILEMLCSRYVHEAAVESACMQYLLADVGPLDTKLFMREYKYTLEQYMDLCSLSPGNIRMILYRLIRGVYALHRVGVIHRDVKPSNILMDDPKTLVVGDYGFATSVRYVNQLSPSNAFVQTEPYRAPEVFLGQTVYGTEIDMWSVGCVMFELFNQQRLLETSSDDSDCYMKELFGIMGIPQADAWSSLPHWSKLQSFGLSTAGRGFVLQTRDKKARNLLKALLTLDPEQRITATDALNHEYFKCYRLDQVPAAGSDVAKEKLTYTVQTKAVPKGMIFYNAKNRRKVFSCLQSRTQHFELSAGNFFFACDLADAFLASTRSKNRTSKCLLMCVCISRPRCETT